MDGTYECDFIAPVERSPDYVSYRTFHHCGGHFGCPSTNFFKDFLKAFRASLWSFILVIRLHKSHVNNHVVKSLHVGRSLRKFVIAVSIICRLFWLWACNRSMCSSKKYPYPLPHRGHCCFRPPPPGISVIFQLGLVPPGKNISLKNAVALFFYAKDNCFCDKERTNILFMLIYSIFWKPT